MKEFVINYGALADAIDVQLRAQGCDYGCSAVAAVEHFQKDADAIVRLHVRGLLPDGHVHKLRKKLHKHIIEMLGDLVVAKTN